MTDRCTAFAKVYISGEATEDATFGRGIVSLLRAIDQTGSLNKACKVVGISYSKAWKRLRKVETQMGAILVEKNGSHGSTLTEEGKCLIKMYDQLNASVNQFAASEFQRLSTTCSLFNK